GPRRDRPVARTDPSAWLPGSGAHADRLPRRAADRTGRSGLRPPARPGRGRSGVRGAAVVPACAPAPARTADRVRRAATPGPRIRALSRRTGATDLGRDRIDPVQPAKSVGGPAMNARGWNTLVQPEAVAATLGQAEVVLVDCRFSLADPAAGERAYRDAHLPGARYAHLDRDLSGPAAASCGRHPWPDADAFTRRLSAWGISPRSRVVAYDAGDGAFAARLWCLLRTLGHETAAVLDGGWARWTGLALPVDVDLPSPAHVPYHAVFDATRLLDADATRRHLDHGGLLVDARAPER